MILKGEHLFVTGGAAGIGEAIVLGAVKEGAKVSFVDIDDAKATTLVEKLTKAGHQVQYAKADVSKFETFKAGYDKLVANFGPVTVAVSNAGRNSYADAVEYAEQEWNDFFALDLKSSWYLAKLCLPEMRKAKYGSIVNISSIHGRMSRPNFFPYSAAKGGIIGLSRNLALDEGKHEIRVNAVSPGYILTDLTKGWLAAESGRTEKANSIQPLGRMGEPNEVAKVVTFLLSDKSTYVSGSDWAVDGGLGARSA